MRLAVALFFCALPFISGAQYDESTAKYLVRVSAAAYSKNPANCMNFITMIGTMSANVGWSNVFGFVGVDKQQGRILVAFRGSTDAGQLIDELLNSSPMNYPWPSYSSAKVMTYFGKGAAGLYQQTVNHVKSAKATYPTWPVYITGHSLGGALAEIVTLQLLADRVLTAVPVFYTFGQPRTGDYQLAVSFNMAVRNAMRVVHAADMVAHIPPCSTEYDSAKKTNVCKQNTGLLWAYHPPTEVWYKGNMPSATGNTGGSFKVCEGTPFGEDSTCSNSLTLKLSIADHLNYFDMSVGGYCGALLKSEMGDEAREGMDTTNVEEVEAKYDWLRAP